MFLQNYWYAAAWAEDIGRDLLARVILNEPIVFYRKEDGTPVALENRCAHRRVQLSKGTLIGDTVQCRYHGLVYDCSGACVRVPGQDRIPKAVRVKSYPVAERHKLIWVWMGDPVRADVSTIPQFPLLDDPAWCQIKDYFHVPANYLLIFDNLSDLSHVAYLHNSYTGNEPIGEHATVKFERFSEGHHEGVRGSRWTYDVEPAQTYKTFGGYTTNVDRWQVYEFTLPGIFKIYNGSAKVGTGATPANIEGGKERWLFKVYHAITPESETSTHYFWNIVHNIGAHTASVCNPLHKQMRAILAEDFDIFCHQQKNIELNPDTPTREIAADAGLIHARRLVASMLERQQAERNEPKSVLIHEV
jgi:phenylpropionate dioxygenase-like ring-hydroxylating dioxygenase large terminal subunit